MIKTFHGHFQQGRFVCSQPIEIPEYLEVLLVVPDNRISAASPRARAVEDVARSIVEAESLDDVMNRTVPRRKVRDAAHEFCASQTQANRACWAAAKDSSTYRMTLTNLWKK
jgi:hypothetical protein